jgi:hypothetical protein
MISGGNAPVEQSGAERSEQAIRAMIGFETVREKAIVVPARREGLKKHRQCAKSFPTTHQTNRV